MFPKAAQALMEAAIDGIVVIDSRGTLIAVNEAASGMFGYRSDELLGANVRMLVPDTDRSAHEAHLQSYLSDAPWHAIGKSHDVVAKRKSGATFPAQLSVGLIRDSAPPRFVGFVHDDSAQAQRDAAACLAQSRLTSVSRLATLGEMAAGIAHELNQPLTAINAYARACERFAAQPQVDLGELRSALREIGAEALRAGEVLRRMRQLLRVDPGERTCVVADTLIEDLKVLVAADARLHGVQVTYRLASGSARVDADAAQLQHLLLNLIRNAFEALAAPTPLRREIEIATAMVDGEVEISVSDNGPGVPPAIANRMFDPFSTSKPNGTGLGLAISRTIAHSHGGRVDHRPVSPHGACFYVRLPPSQGVAA